jgi:hypothetical protein
MDMGWSEKEQGWVGGRVGEVVVEGVARDGREDHRDGGRGGLQEEPDHKLHIA